MNRFIDKHATSIIIKFIFVPSKLVSLENYIIYIDRLKKVNVYEFQGNFKEYILYIISTIQQNAASALASSYPD